MMKRTLLDSFASTGVNIMDISVSSDCIGTLHTRTETILGGYEVDISPNIYGLPNRQKAEREYRVMSAMSEVTES